MTLRPALKPIGGWLLCALTPPARALREAERGLVTDRRETSVTMRKRECGELVKVVDPDAAPKRSLGRAHTAGERLGSDGSSKRIQYTRKLFSRLSLRAVGVCLPPVNARTLSVTYSRSSARLTSPSRLASARPVFKPLRTE